MPVVMFGKWCSKAKKWFLYDRVYTNTGKWTPICVMRFRHVGRMPNAT